MFLQVTLSPDRHILLVMDPEIERRKETIDIHYSDSGDTNNMKFSFVSHLSIPLPRNPKYGGFAPSVLTFSADRSKFAIATAFGRMSVWDIPRKVPSKTFIEGPESAPKALVATTLYHIT